MDDRGVKTSRVASEGDATSNWEFVMYLIGFLAYIALTEVLGCR